MDCEAPMVTEFPPAAIWPAAPKYCAVVGELRLVSVAVPEGDVMRAQDAVYCVRQGLSPAE